MLLGTYETYYATQRNKREKNKNFEFFKLLVFIGNKFMHENKNKKLVILSGARPKPLRNHQNPIFCFLSSDSTNFANRVSQRSICDLE